MSHYNVLYGPSCPQTAGVAHSSSQFQLCDCPYKLHADCLTAGLTLLLSLRFMALVFDEVRNLCLGLAARNIQWKSLGPAAGLQVSAQMFTRLFGNLMQRSDSIATSMQARGFVGPKGHEVHLARVQKPNIAADVAALALLAGSTYAAQLLT